MRLLLLVLLAPLAILASTHSKPSASHLHQAIQDGDLDRLKALLQEDSHLLSAALIKKIARSAQALDILSTIAEHYVYSDNKHLCTLLHTLITECPAKSSGMTEIITWLASKWRPAAGQRRNPLMIAAGHGQPGLMKAMLAIPRLREALELEDNEGRTPIFMVSSPAELFLLIEAGPRLEHVNHAGHTCLHVIAERMEGALQFVEWYRRETWPSDGSYMLNQAILRRTFKMLKMCILAGADPLAKVKGDGMSVYEMVGVEYAQGLQQAYACRVQVETEVLAIQSEVGMGPALSYISHLPVEIQHLLIQLLYRPLLVKIEALAHQ